MAECAIQGRLLMASPLSGTDDLAALGFADLSEVAHNPDFRLFPRGVVVPHRTGGRAILTVPASG